MARVALWRDIQELHNRIDNLQIKETEYKMNWEVIEKELTELRASRDAVLKMIADLKAVIEDSAKADNEKIAHFAASLDEVGKSLEAALAPKDDTGSTGGLPD